MNGTSTDYPVKFYQSFNNFPLGDISNYCAAITSIFSNFLLIFVISHVKCYNRNVRISMYYMAFWRLVFSVSVGLTSPVIKYFTSTKTLLIIKNGFTLPVYIGQAFLVIFIVSIVMFCNGPVVQYLQVKTILKATSKQDANFGIFLIPISIGIPALALVCLGYIPKSEVFPQEIMNKMKNQGMATTLTIPMALEMANIMPLICASFIFLVMLVSIIFAISCFVRIKILMKQKFAASTSSSSKKSQDQLNTMLLIQNVREVLQDKFLPRKISVSDGKSSTQDVVLQKRSR